MDRRYRPVARMARGEARLRSPDYAGALTHGSNQVLVYIVCGLSVACAGRRERKARDIGFVRHVSTFSAGEKHVARQAVHSTNDGELRGIAELAARRVGPSHGTLF